MEGWVLEMGPKEKGQEMIKVVKTYKLPSIK